MRGATVSGRARSPRIAPRRSASGGDRPLWRALVPAIMLLAGILFATSAETARGTDLRSGRRLELTSLISGEERSVAGATRQVTSLQNEVDDLEKTAGAGDVR